MSDTTRTQDEIVQRVHAVRPDDVLGWHCEVLIPQLDYDHAREFLKPDVTAEEWAADLAADRGEHADLTAVAASYLTFAFGKAYDERSISAERSINKLTEYAWLLGRDELAERMASGREYGSYGLPLLRAFAEEFDLPVERADR